MKRGILSICLTLLLCLGLLVPTALAEPGDTYLALGDSITTGYGPNGKVDNPFANQVAAAQGYTLNNQAADGETTGTLKTKLEQGQIDVSNAKLISITIGGNDLMDALYEFLAEKYVEAYPESQDFDADVVQELLMSGDQDFLAFAVGKISAFGFSSQATSALGNLSTNLGAIIAAIKQANPTATILVATQYNPYYYLANASALPEMQTISNAFETGLTFLNQAIKNGAATNYEVVDVYTAFKNAVDDTPSVNPCNPSSATLDFHPNQTGHSLIAAAINALLPQSSYNLWVSGTQVTSYNYPDVLGDGTVAFDPSTNTLTLDNADLTMPDHTDKLSIILSRLTDTLNIMLVGENTITAQGEIQCIASEAGGLTFAQDGATPGKLTARAEGTRGCIVASAEKDITFQSGTYDLYANESNVITSGANGTLHITGTAEITATSQGDDVTPVIGGHPVIIDGKARLICDTTGCAISCSGGTDYAFKLAGNAYVSIDGSRDNYNVELLFSSLEDMLITDNAVLECRSHATDNEDLGYFAPVIYPDGSLHISGNANVIVEGPGNAIESWADFVFTGGTLTTISQTGYGVWTPDGSIEISGPSTVLNTFKRDGDGNIIPSFRGIGANGNISITGGATVTMPTIEGPAIYSVNSTNISGSVVELSAEDGAQFPTLWVRNDLSIENSWVKTDGASATDPVITNSVYICDDAGSVYGTAAVPVNRELPVGTTLTVPAGAVLAIPDGVTLTNSSTLAVEGILEVRNDAHFTGTANVSGKVYVLETDGGTNPVNGVTFTLSESGEVYAQLTALTGTTIEPASRTSGSYSYTPVNGSEETFTSRWSYYVSTGGGGVSSYSISVEKTDNGTVTLHPSQAYKGTTVTATVTPDAGYELAGLTVTDASGNVVAVTKVSDTQYTFKMPASNVTVKATFVKEVPVSTLPFVDVEIGDWFYGAVQYVYDNDMMNGMGNNRFAPNTALSRGMIVQVLYNLEQKPAVGSGSFTDVPPGTWYADAVNWAASHGIVSGYGNGQFGPENNITREQLATILYRYARYKGYDVSVGEDTNILSYTDALEISEYAIPAFQWACGAGIMEGSAGALHPQDNATRAQVAAMLMRFCEYYADRK